MAGPVAAAGLIIAYTAFVLPGDVPFFAEMATLLLSAGHANATPSHFLGISLPFSVAKVGIGGTRGLAYGPLPVWIYQVILAITQNPVAIVSIRVLVVEGVTFTALFWLARTIRLNAWYVPLSMLSPWLWMYSRVIWDNSFCIPLSALAIAAYGDFILSRRRYALTLSAICLAAMTLVHLMSLALIAAIALHAILFQRRGLERNRWSLAGVALLWFAIFWIYFHAAANQSVHVMAINNNLCWWFPLFGGHHMEAGFDFLPTVHNEAPAIFAVLQSISLLPNLAVWGGMALVVLRCLRSIRGGDSFSTIDHLAILSLMTAISQGFLDAAEHVHPLSHYFNATWVCYLILAWYAVEAARIRVAKPVLTIGVPIAIYAASLLGVLGISIYILHRDQGTMAPDYGATLSQQISAIREVEKYAPQSRLLVQAYEWHDYPDTPRELLNLITPPPGPHPLRTLVARNRNLWPGDPGIAIDAYPYNDMP